MAGQAKVRVPVDALEELAARTARLLDRLQAGEITPDEARSEASSSVTEAEEFESALNAALDA